MGGDYPNVARVAVPLLVGPTVREARRQIAGSHVERWSAVVIGFEKRPGDGG